MNGGWVGRQVDASYEDKMAHLAWMDQAIKRERTAKEQSGWFWPLVIRTANAMLKAAGAK